MGELAWPGLLPALLAGAAALLAVSLLAVWIVRRAGPRAQQRGVTIANIDVLTAEPAFRRRLRGYRLLLLLGLAVTAAAVVLSAYTVSRPVVSSTLTPETKNRDIVLCLDVSSSMSSLDAEVLTSFEELAGSFTGERIALVLFDGSPLQVFPLTTDYDYVRERLSEVKKELPGGRYNDGTRVGGGLSLIGDGVAGCLLQFDQPTENRSRTLILGTDYRSTGDSLVATARATGLAVERGVTIDGINPMHRNGNAASTQFEADVVTTGGLYFAASTPAESEAAVVAIVDGVTSEAATVTREAPVRIVADTPDAAIWLLLPLVVSVLLVAARSRL